MEELEKVQRLLGLEEPSFREIKQGIKTLLEEKKISSSEAVEAAFEVGRKFGEDSVLSKLE